MKLINNEQKNNYFRQKQFRIFIMI